jgi:hypothetical protein
VGGFSILRNYLSEVAYKKSVDSLIVEDYKNANDFIVEAIRKNKNRDYYHIQATKVALALLKQSSESEQNEDTDALQLYYVKVINREIEEAISINEVNYNNWEVASVVYKQLIDLTQGKLYGDQTLTSATKAVELNPFNPNNYITLGYVMKYNTNEELQVKAEEVFIQAYRLNPRYPLSIFALGSYWEFVEKYDDAKQLYETSLNTHFINDTEMADLLRDRIGMLDELQNASESQDYENVEEKVIQEVEESVLQDTETETAE